jgi:glycosyltransferase involved in cell wall biosynthesis
VGDLDGLTRAISDVSNDDGLRKELAAAGPARASTFSWPRAARETADVYRSLGVAVGGG